MHAPSAKEFLDAGILGVELAVIGIIGAYILRFVPAKYQKYVQKYMYFFIGIVVIVIGMFVHRKLIEIGMLFIAIQIMVIIMEEVLKR